MAQHEVVKFLGPVLNAKVSDSSRKSRKKAALPKDDSLQSTAVQVHLNAGMESR